MLRQNPSMHTRLGKALFSAILILANFASAAESVRPTVETIVQADGSVWFDGRRVEGSKAVEMKLQELAAQTPRPVLRLIPNKDVSYEAMYSFLEAVQKAGVQINMVGNIAPK